MKIYKYELETVSTFELELPKHINPLCIKEQNGKPMLWAVVDETAEVLPHKFWCVWTGRTLPKEIKDIYNRAGRITPKYIDTVQIGEMVYHYFLKCPLTVENLATSVIENVL